MGRIPIYQSEQRLTAEAPNVKVSPNVFGTEGRDMQGAGEAITGVSDAFHKAYQTAQLTQAKAKWSKALYETRIQLENDTEDYNTAGERYTKILNDHKENVLGEIGDPIVRQQMDLDMENDRGLEMVRVNQVARQRMVDSGVASYAAYKDAATKRYHAETSQTSKDKIRQEIKDTIASMAASRIISEVDANKETLELDQKLDYQQAVNDMQTDPATMMDLLKHGYYKNLDEESKNKLEGMATSLARQRAKDAKVAVAREQDKTYADYALKYAQRQLTLQDIEDGLAKKLPDGSPVLDPSRAISLSKAIVSSKSGEGKSNITALDAVQDLLIKYGNDAVSGKEVHDFIVDKTLSRDLSTKDGERYLLALRKSGYEGEMTTGNKGNGPAQFLGQALSGIKHFAMQLVLPISAQQEVRAKVVDAVVSGTDPKQINEVARQAARDAIIKRNPSLANIPPEGEIRHDPVTGKNMLIKPDPAAIFKQIPVDADGDVIEEEYDTDETDEPSYNEDRL